MSPSLVPREDDLARTKITFRDDYEREKDIELSKELYVAYPQNVDFKNGLAISYAKLAQVAVAKSDNSTAKKYLQEAEKHFIELHQISPQNATYKGYLDIIREILEMLK